MFGIEILRGGAACSAVLNSGPEYPHLEEKWLGYLRVPAVCRWFAGVHFFREAKHDEFEKKSSVLRGFEITELSRSKATMHGSCCAPIMFLPRPYKVCSAEHRHSKDSQRLLAAPRRLLPHACVR